MALLPRPASTMQTSRLVTLALLACGALAAVGRGQDILITPTAITSSTSGTDSFSAVHLIDGSGLSNTPTLANLGTHAAPDSSNAWVTTDSSPDYFLFLPNPVLTCALGSTHFVSELVLWGDDGSPNEAKSFTVTFSIDGTRFSNAINLTSPARLGGFPTRLPFPGGARVASHVRVTVTDNYYSFFPPRTAGGDRVGLGEIRFAGQSYGSVIVDNLANSTDGEDFLDPANGAPNKVAAHAFTTGPAPLVLESITLRMRNGGGSPNAHAKLWSGAGSVPVTELADLGEVTVTSVMDAEHTFVGGGVILAASTRYWVTVRNEIAGAALAGPSPAMALPSVPAAWALPEPSP